jgi:electron transfer flavoprotein alpha/beta subunit
MIRIAALLGSAADLGLVTLGLELGETTALSLSPPATNGEDWLGGVLGAGATRCIRLWDDAIADVDYLGRAGALAALVRTAMGDLKAAPVVVLAGDLGRGAVGPAVAERLGLTHLSRVVGVQALDGKLVIRRRVGATVRLFSAPPPFLLCVSRLPAPRQSEAAGWTEALATEESWDLSRVGLSPQELLHRRHFRLRPSPGPAARPRQFTDAAALALRLRDDGLLGSGGS